MIRARSLAVRSVGDAPQRRGRLTSLPLRPDDPFAFLDRLAAYERGGRLVCPTTDRVRALVAELGHPERSYPAIHVTGTNGKGSTAAMIAALLASCGLRVGAYTSPHIDRVAERVAVGGRPVDDPDLARAIGHVASAAARIGITPTWFEALTVAGLWLLAAREVDVAVIEVGMLGRWDATNVVDGSVAVVTNVQLDHTDVAGPTRAHIAAEKAGIVKPGATLVLGEADPGLRPIFEAEDPARILAVGGELSWANRVATQSGSIVDLVNPWGVRTGVRIGMLGEHQCDNALLALSAAEAFIGTEIPVAVVDSVLARIQVPGRSEVIHRAPTVIVDGAHNPAGAAALRLATLDALPEARPRVLLWGSLAGRDPIPFLEALGARELDLMVATEPISPRALPAGVLGLAARSRGLATAIAPDPARALEHAVSVAGRDGLVIATGSLHLIGPLRGWPLPAAAPGRGLLAVGPVRAGSLTRLTPGTDGKPTNHSGPGDDLWLRRPHCDNRRSSRRNQVARLEDRSAAAQAAC